MHEDILTFWFDELEPKAWFEQSDAFDAMIVTRFGAVLERAARCELFGWRATPKGRLAEVIVLDQFSRNAYRGTAQAFAQDPMALALAQEAVANGEDLRMTRAERNFLYMPYMHSESLAIHEEGMKLYKANGDENTYDYEDRHRAIIERFGRYPHRNEILGRASTAQELAFLTEPGSSF